METETELDDLIVPYLPRLFQTLAVAIVLLKTGEVLLGLLYAALVGLIGGTVITLGLLLKDIVYDWFYTVIIFGDHLKRIGDILKVQRMEQEGIELFASTHIAILSANAVEELEEIVVKH